jgi:MFS family permease
VITPLTSIIMGILCDKYQNSRLVLVLLNLGIIAALAILFISKDYLPVILCMAVYGFCFAPVNDLVDKMLIDKLGKDSPRFGRIRIGGTFGRAIGVGISGCLMLLLNVHILFVAFWLMMLCCTVICGTLPKTTTEYAKPHAKDFLDIVKNKSFVLIYVTLMVFGFTESGSSHFEALHILRRGYPSYYTSLFMGVQMIGECIAFWLAPKAIRRLNLNLIICIAFSLQVFKSASLQALGYLPLAFTIIGQSISGGAFALMYSAMAHTIFNTFRGNVSNVAQTMKSMATQGVGMTIGVLAFGRVYDLGSTTTLYGILAALSFLCVLFFLARYLILKKPKPGFPSA